MSFEAPKKTKVFIARAVIFCMVVFIGAIIISTVFSKKKTIIRPEQFAAELSEANRQSDVESQLRAAEPGDLLVWKDGAVLGVVSNDYNSHNSILLVTTCLSGLTKRYRSDELRTNVINVRKFSSDPWTAPKYAEAAYHFVRCQPMVQTWP